MAKPPDRHEGPPPAEAIQLDRSLLAAVAAAVAVLYPGCRCTRIEVDDEP